jgi:sugar transferase (PEP-CTERM/EpsH1 system associated)
MVKRETPPLVVHIIYALGTGGLENGLVNIINRASPERYRHAIVCLTKTGDFASRLTARDVPVISLNKRPGHDLGVYWRLWKVLRQLRPAVIHTRNLAALEMQAVALLFPRTRRVHGEHGRDIYDLDGSNRRYRLLRKALNRFIHRYVAVSEDLRGWLVDSIGISSRRVQQIYNGVDPQHFFPRSGPRAGLLPNGFMPDDGVLLGTVGRLAEVKDQRSLLRAMHLLLEERPALRRRLRLALVGDGPLFDDLQQAARDWGIAELLWMPGDREDILEAMASGLPVVATRTGGNPELVREGYNGFLVPVSDPHALAVTLHGMIDDMPLSRRMGETGREIVLQRFSWERTVENYLSIYDELLAANMGGR